ncbi:MAG TPA: coenzyme F420-0:L-glutamate ligase [Nocardioidaceae bacterium]|nr:coenzyme F420-0:L-glutamate ligase [Nocardioidaceae bacterium]
MTSSLTVVAVEGIGEVTRGTDLAALIAPSVQDGDIVVVTSKVVSKAEGRVVELDRDEAVDRETDRVVARRGPTRIVRNRLGLTLAAAGVDASNTEAGTVVLLPLDPDASARRLRAQLTPNVAVVVSDTAGRAWRHGQTDIAVGAAGLEVAHDYAGRVDTYGNELAVTLPAIADELAAAGDLVKSKLSGCPVAIVRGLAHLVLPPGEDGPGAVSLVRQEDQDMFGFGAREAVMHALRLDDHRGFGATASADVLVDALRSLELITAVEGDLVVTSRDARAVAAAYAHGWEVAEETVRTMKFRVRPS